MPRNIFLVGFMATGKTHARRELSRLTGWPLIDSDDEIVDRAGKSIARVFEEEGETAFRALEREIIRDLCAGEGRIIACGGGAFIDPENRDRMLGGGLVVCLSARPETVYDRVIAEAGSGAPARPLLAGGNPLERIRDPHVPADRSLFPGPPHHRHRRPDPGAGGSRSACHLPPGRRLIQEEQTWLTRTLPRWCSIPGAAIP